MQIRNLFTNEDRAVSPVIGVILMVAITVILAAVIGTFVLGLGSNVQQNAQAGVTFSQSGDTLTITVNSIQRAEEFRVTVKEAATGTADVGNSYASGTALSVGESIDITSVETDDKITVIASYEGNDNVIGEYTVK